MTAYGNKTSATLSEVLQNGNIFPEEMHVGSDLGGQISIDLGTSGLNVDKIAMIIKLMAGVSKKAIQVIDNDGTELFSILPNGNISIGNTEVVATAAEINYLQNASSEIQTQINNIDNHSRYSTVETEGVITAELVDGQSIDNAIDGLIATHKALASDHHPKYTTAESEAVITAELIDGQSINNAIDSLIATHKALASDHHPKYALTDDLASSEITALQNIGALTIIFSQWTSLAKSSEGANQLKIGDVLIQWGSATPSGGQIAVTYPIAYTSTPFIFATNISGISSSASSYGIHVSARSTSACTIQGRLINDLGANTDVTDTTGDIMWLAIGIKTN